MPLCFYTLDWSQSNIWWHYIWPCKQGSLRHKLIVFVCVTHYKNHRCVCYGSPKISMFVWLCLEPMVHKSKLKTKKCQQLIQLQFQAEYLLHKVVSPEQCICTSRCFILSTACFFHILDQGHIIGGFCRRKLTEAIDSQTIFEWQ